MKIEQLDELKYRFVGIDSFHPFVLAKPLNGLFFIDYLIESEFLNSNDFLMFIQTGVETRSRRNTNAYLNSFIVKLFSFAVKPKTFGPSGVW